ncbi:hypothetical protein Btru_052730 [Bulinus truncatus]|nr:hypothetical protein Btru_052730 [Bulinus truncatus]
MVKWSTWGRSYSLARIKLRPTVQFFRVAGLVKFHREQHRTAQDSGGVLPVTACSVYRLSLKTAGPMTFLGVASRLVLISLATNVALTYFIVPDMTDKLYTRKGDINIGVIISMTDYEPNKPCGDKVSDFQTIELTESIVFAVDKINSEKKLLPNLTLGFVMTDACHKETVAAIQALRFTPNSNEEDYTQPNVSTYLQSFRVVAVLGTDESSTSMSATQVLNTGKLTLMTFWAYDNRLSDISYYPNFYSISAPETYLIHAALRYFAFKQWYYINLVHDDSQISENLLREMKKIVRFNSFCISSRIKVTEKTNITRMVEFFIQNDTSSKIMFVIANTPVINRISITVRQMGAVGKLLWVGLEKWTDFMNSVDSIQGSIGIHFYTPQIPGLAEHYQKLDHTSPNPWLKPAFKTLYNCSDKVCLKRFLIEQHSQPNIVSALTYIATETYAKAIGLHLQIHCPRVSRENAQACFLDNIATFPQSLRNISIPGYEDTIKINERGYVMESFMVYQKSIKGDGKPRPLVRITTDEDELVKLNDLDWLSYQFRFEMLNPSYFCMPTCAHNEYQYPVSKCCWSCRRCQDNEKVSDKTKVCEQCPVLYWPKEINQHSVCQFILPNYYQWDEPVPALLIGLSMGGVATCLVVLLLYMRNRHHPVIRASSIELSCVQLASCILGYFAVPIFLMKPNDMACKVAIFLFRFSSNILFLTMLIKAIRVYRIFKLSKKNKKITFTGTHFLLLICGCHFVLEALELYITNMFYPLSVEVTQPEIKVNYTELSCKFEKAHLLPFFIFDFFLLIMCSLFAFKTQTLPKNFRESRFVSMCIITTLILWIAFMPAYMTLLSNNAKTLLLVCAILINQTNLIIFIFITRLVAWKYHKSHRKSLFLTLS